MGLRSSTAINTRSRLLNAASNLSRRGERLTSTIRISSASIGAKLLAGARQHYPARELRPGEPVQPMRPRPKVHPDIGPAAVLVEIAIFLRRIGRDQDDIAPPEAMDLRTRLDVTGTAQRRHHQPVACALGPVAPAIFACLGRDTGKDRKRLRCRGDVSQRRPCPFRPWPSARGLAPHRDSAA